MATKKKEKPTTVVVKGSHKGKGAVHKVYKDKKGDIIVDHAGKNNPKWDKIDLTKKGGAKTIKQGVKAVKDWHKKNG
jgi:hypothetical protein